MQVILYPSQNICFGHSNIVFTFDHRSLTVVGPTGVYQLDFFCSGIQFYLLLSPYLCFISFLYLIYYYLFVLGDVALIS